MRTSQGFCFAEHEALNVSVFMPESSMYELSTRMDKENMNRDLLLREKCIQLWRAGSTPRTIATTGLSMRPLIVEGSTLTVVPSVGDRSIAVGDIALFERAENLVAHRIVGRFYRDGSLWFREKGDNTFATGIFPAGSLIGRVIKIEHSEHVHDLTTLRPRIAGRLIGIYWSGLFALLRWAVALKRMLFGASKTRRLRTYVLNTVRFLSRLPNRFFRQ